MLQLPINKFYNIHPGYVPRRFNPATNISRNRAIVEESEAVKNLVLPTTSHNEIQNVRPTMKIKTTITKLGAPTFSSSLVTVVE